MSGLNLNVICVIPSRLGSTRLPRKALLELGGKSIIQHVYERACSLTLFSDVIVATDHQDIADVIKGFGGHYRMTSDKHETGTDRIAEVAEDIDCDIVVNLQGDEPFIEPSTISKCLEPLLKDPSVVMATLKHLIGNAEEINDPNVVKVVTDISNNALYFSRSPIPFYRADEKQEYFRHIGIYAYRKDFLMKFAYMRQTPLSRKESLEQLRALENGYQIKVLPTDDHPLGIDTEEDYEKAKKLMSSLDNKISDWDKVSEIHEEAHRKLLGKKPRS